MWQPIIVKSREREQYEGWIEIPPPELKTSRRTSFSKVQCCVSFRGGMRGLRRDIFIGSQKVFFNIQLSMKIPLGQRQLKSSWQRRRAGINRLTWKVGKKWYRIYLAPHSLFHEIRSALRKNPHPFFVRQCWWSDRGPVRPSVRLKESWIDDGKVGNISTIN